MVQNGVFQVVPGVQGAGGGMDRNRGSGEGLAPTRMAAHSAAPARFAGYVGPPAGCKTALTPKKEKGSSPEGRSLG